MKKLLLSQAFLLTACATTLSNVDTTREPAAKSASLKSVFPTNSNKWVHISFAELAKYEYLFAVSDIHGQDENLKAVMKQGELVNKGPDNKLHWTARNTLLIVVGDAINKGPDSAGVILFLKKIMDEAPKYNSKVIYLLGNHEAGLFVDSKGGKGLSKEFKLSIYDPKKDEQKSKSRLIDLYYFQEEVLKENSSCAKSIGEENKISPTENKITEDKKSSEFDDKIVNGAMGCFLKNLPVGALVGDTLFVHSGMFPEYKEPALKKYIQNDVTNASIEALGNEKNIASSLLSGRDWTRHGAEADRTTNLASMDALGIKNIVIGHDPQALASAQQKHIRIDRYLGRIIALESGMSGEHFPGHLGRMLKCETKVIYKKNPEQISFADVRHEKVEPLCTEIGSETGAAQKIEEPIFVEEEFVKKKKK